DGLSQLEYTSAHNLFSLLRDSGTLNPVIHGDVNAQLPLLMIFWTIAFGLLFFAFLSPARRRLAIGLAGVATALVLNVMHPGAIWPLPSFLTYIQFPYRLMTYVDLALVGLATLAIAAMQRSGTTSRVPAALLVLVAALSFYAAIVQNAQV